MCGANQSKREVITIRLCGTELHVEEIMTLSLPPPPCILSPFVCESLLTYSPNSFDRDYGALMGDRKRLGETEFWVMKQQCQGMIYEQLFPPLCLR